MKLKIMTIFLLTAAVVQIVASSVEFYEGHKIPYGGVNNNGDISVRGSDGLIHQDSYYYSYTNSINPLGGVNNNGNVGVRGSDGTLRQGDERYASAYGDGYHVTKKPYGKDKVKTKKNYKEIEKNNEEWYN